VLWRDNNSSSKGVANRVTYQDFKTSGNNPPIFAQLVISLNLVLAGLRLGLKNR
jgi:hypothetical protein